MQIVDFVDTLCRMICWPLLPAKNYLVLDSYHTHAIFFSCTSQIFILSCILYMNQINVLNFHISIYSLYFVIQKYVHPKEMLMPVSWYLGGWKIIVCCYSLCQIVSLPLYLVFRQNIGAFNTFVIGFKSVGQLPNFCLRHTSKNKISGHEGTTVCIYLVG